ncbi:MAG: hypothetical protein Unbinned4162contig1001_9 [Prokaryotic dsDNA virus sp.]|nr:MAG: hypothetical protein Unbinned4162contig1001_9 [Prokaryotic dsDNA virus sp.]|tara:strand:+ start:23752 stop:24345 length:594 start_codon:yes stop_codon:yes gene_type:complete
MKTYSNKSNARRAARKQFESDEQFALVENAEGRWMFHATAEHNDQLNEEFLDETVPGFSHCPDCGIHLSNGVSDYETQKLIAKQEKAPEAAIKKEYLCLGCDHEFGEVVKPAKTTAPTGKGLKIEKDREERNGIKRPSAGGKCAAVWEKCESYYNEAGVVPTPSKLKQWAEDNGHNFNNVSIELYRWRNWMGFKGRK